MSYLNYSPDAVFLYYILIFENQQWDIPNNNYGNFYQVSIIQSEDIRILEGPLCFETVGISWRPSWILTSSEGHRGRKFPGFGFLALLVHNQ